MEILTEIAVGVIEVVGCVCKTVDFQVAKGISGELGEKPVHDHSAFDAALTVQDEDDLFISAGQEGTFYHCVSGSDILCGVVEASLDETLDYVKDKAVAGSLFSCMAQRQDGVDTHVGLLTPEILL